MKQTPCRRHDRGGGARRRSIAGWLVLVIGVLVAIAFTLPALALASSGTTTRAADVSLPTPSPTWTHPVPEVTTAEGVTVDVEQCFTCHSTTYQQWQNSSPYTGGPYGDLKGHNLTLSDAFLSVGHNSTEILSNDCEHCMSPFSERTFGGTSTVDIGSFVQPISMTPYPTSGAGAQAGPWVLQSPYALLQSTLAPRSGYLLPSEFYNYTPAAGQALGAFEGVSCRACHDVTHLVQQGAALVPSLAYFNGDTWSYEPVANPDQLCLKCHLTDDSRNPPVGAVHAGLQCIDCHMDNFMNQNGDYNHSFNAGLPTDLAKDTSCNQIGCHRNGIHPAVESLQTSFKYPGLYPANQPRTEPTAVGDPGQIGTGLDGLLYDAAARHNIHAITCDTCHQPTGVSTHYTVVYGTMVNLTITGHRISNAGIPASAATGVVQLWVRHSADQLYSLAGVAGSASSAVGTPFVLRPSKPLTTNSLVYVTQGNDADGFPGLGRGTEATVSVKALVTLRTSADRVQPRGWVKLSVAVAPAKAGQKVYIQLSHNGRTWSTVSIVKLASSSTATLSWRAPATAGRLFLRLRYLGDKVNVGNFSPTRTVTVN